MVVIRDFIDAIMQGIGSTSLTDDEYATVTSSAPGVYSAGLYAELLAIMNTRDAVSTTRDRLRYVFLAAGVDLGELADPKPTSNIFLGEPL